VIEPLKEINAYILIGGQSRRLKTDKSLVKINGKSLTEIVHEKLNDVFMNIYVVGKENKSPDYNFIQDIKPVQCPLNGIITAIEHSQNDWIFVIACDLPMVKTGTINNIYRSVDSNTQVALPVVEKRLQPLCAFYHKSVFKNFENAIVKGNYSLMILLNHLEVKEINIDEKDTDQFLNINRPKDLERASKLLRL